VSAGPPQGVHTERPFDVKNICGYADLKCSATKLTDKITFPTESGTDTATDTLRRTH
jgi:hypothetical protein